MSSYALCLIPEDSNSLPIGIGEHPFPIIAPDSNSIIFLADFASYTILSHQSIYISNGEFHLNLTMCTSYSVSIRRYTLMPSIIMFLSLLMTRLPLPWTQYINIFIIFQCCKPYPLYPLERYLNLQL